jgi:peptidoglycan/xylan/chitin deacetylase (PgdA/CDA1 family)
MKGTFYVNLGITTFKGAGTLKDRLEYLTKMGFEIGNHTKTHVSLPSIKTKEKIMEEVGGNQKLMLQLIPGYYFNSFSLPFGGAAKNLTQYVIKGEYQGVKYENKAILLVGANPAPSPTSPKFNPLELPRVRANGLISVNYDLNWWIGKLEKGSSQYISDGNPDTITVPISKQKNVDMTKLGGKRLITY